MAEPTTALSTPDLIKRIAEKLKIASYSTTGEAIAPTDRNKLDICMRILNGGIQLLLSDAPPKGWRWMRRKSTIELDAEGTAGDSIDSDAGRYDMPDDFGGEIFGQLVCPTLPSDIEWVEPTEIRKLWLNSPATGRTKKAALMAYGTRQYELMVWPKPAAAEDAKTLEFEYNKYFDKLSMVSGTATGGGATTLVDSNRDELDDTFNTWVLTVIDGAGKYETATVTDFVQSSGTFSYSALSGASTPDTTSSYFVQPVANLHPAGYKFDHVVLVAAFAYAQITGELTGEDMLTKYFATILPLALSLDERSNPVRRPATSQMPSDPGGNINV